jgi:hypothetical protein
MSSRFWTGNFGLLAPEYSAGDENWHRVYFKAGIVFLYMWEHNIYDTRYVRRVANQI